MIKSVMFGAAFLFAVGPGTGPIPVSEESVPLPMAISTSDLDRDSSAAAPVTVAAQEHGAVASGSQTREVRVLGRSLSLSLMRADRMGLAVLSVPERSVISSLPDLAPEAFRSLVALESGCRPIGQIQVVGSRAGTLALATGLSCS